MAPLEHDIAVSGAVAVVRLRGELDLASAAELGPELERLAVADGVEAAVLDLRDLEFMDSSGLRMVANSQLRFRDAGRRFALVPGREPVQRVFEITRMAERLDWVSDPGEVGGAP
jgi:anti-anti-sigma factor